MYQSPMGKVKEKVMRKNEKDALSKVSIPYGEGKNKNILRDVSELSARY